MWEFDDESADDWTPGPEVTKALYARWRDARRGTVPAEKLNNPVWDWLIRTRISAYTANKHFAGPDSLQAGAAWCFARYGQSRTTLPDGRTLLVAGEHEDYYDADFFIYNDVVIRHPDGALDIHGYPERDFPPTDFHTATRHGERLILVGNLGYVQDRRPGETQVLSLDIHTLAIEPLITTGENPGWISMHAAVLTEGGIVVRGGEVQDAHGLVENIDEWRLDLDALLWTRLTDRRWPRFEFVRQDGEMNRLWELRHHLTLREFSALPGLNEETQAMIRATTELMESLNAEREELAPAPELLARLYRPQMDHEVVQRDEENTDEYNVHRIVIGGVVVRYVEDSQAVTLTVEGELPPAVLDRLVGDLRDKLNRLENASYLARRRG